MMSHPAARSLSLRSARARRASVRCATTFLLVGLAVAAAGTGWSRAQGAPADPAERSAAIQSLMEERSHGMSRLAKATAATWDALNRIAETAGDGSARGPQAPRDSDAERAQMVLLEMQNLGIAYTELLNSLDARNDPSPQAFEPIDRVLRLGEALKLERPSAGALARSLKRIEKEAGSALRSLRRDPPRPARLLINPIPEVTRDPVPLTGAMTSSAASPIVNVLPGAPPSLGTSITPDITALAAALGNDPLRIYLYVRNNFRFETYFGFLKGAQATLETRGGNDYDLAVLTGALLQAAGYNIRYSRGTAMIPAQAMIEWLGVENSSAPNTILNTAGISAVPVTINSVIDHYRVDRFWVEVEAAQRPGSPVAWLPLDTAFKRHTIDPGVTGILASVPFDETSYLAMPRTELTSDFYQQQVRAWLLANTPGTTVDKVPLGMTVIPETLGGLPRSLPYQLFAGTTIYASMPSSLMHKATIRLRYLGGTQFSRQIILPDTSLQRITVSYRVNPSQQSIVDGYGGLANTPPGAVSVIPDLKLDGVTQVSGGLIPYLATVSLETDFFKPEGDIFDGTSTHTLRAGEWSAIGIDSYQISETLLQRVTDTVVAAIALKNSGGTPDPDQMIGAFLWLAIMQYHRDVRLGDEVITGLAHYRQVVQVSEGAALANQQIFSVGGTPFTTVPGALTVDVPRLNRSSFALDATSTQNAAVRRITGIHGSAREHALWEGFLNLAGVSTIKSLQLAHQSGNPVFVIDDTDSDPNNNCSVLCPQLNLDSFTEANIQADVASGRRVTVPKNPTPLNNWTGVGYITELVSTGAAGYIISGGLASASDAASSGTVPPSVASGGAITVILQDGTILIIPVGLLGNGQGTGLTGDPVNIANGNFFREDTDFAIPALLEPLGFHRSYNSSSTYNGPLGLGWTHQYTDVLIPQPNNDVIWIDGHGTAYTFTAGAPGSYTSPPGLARTLSFSGGVYTLAAPDGLTVLFNSAGRMTSRKDRNNNTYAFGYDGLGRLSTVTDPATRALTLTYNAGNRIATVADYTGRTWTYGYDAGGRLNLVTSPSDANTPARVIGYTYDTAGRMITVTEPNGGVRQIRYYSSGRVARVIDPLGGSMNLVYNPYKGSTAVTNERGLTEIHGFNSSGNPISIQHPDGTIDRWTYVNNLMTSHTDPLGGVETYEYNGNSDVTRSVDATLKETTYEYLGPYAGMTKITRPVGRPMLFGYDGQGNVNLVTDPLLKTRSQINNAQGLPSSVTDQRSITTNLTYNVDGQLATRTKPLSYSEVFNYNPRGTLLNTTNANSAPKSFTYDLLDRLKTTTDAGSNIERRFYDAAGQLTQVTDVRGGVTTFEYDLLGRLTKLVNPDLSFKRFEYDAVGNVTAQFDELGRATRHTYDSRNRCIRTVFPDGGIATRQYDGAGRVIAIIDPLGNKTRTEYDAAGRVTKQIDALNKNILRTYDTAGNLDTVTDRRGAVSTYKYDANLRVTQVSASAGRLTTFDYDNAGNELDRTRYDISGVGTLPPDPRTLPEAIKRHSTRTYNALGQPDTETNAENKVTQFTYSPGGNVTSVTDPRMNTTAYHYNYLDKVDIVTQPDTGISTIAYDAAGNRTQITAPNGGKYKWTFDNRNRVSTQTDPLGNVTSFKYDSVGNLILQTNPGGSWVRRAYDPMNRLRRTDRSDGTWTERIYDRAGNLVKAITEKTQLDLGYDQLNRLVTETVSIKGTSFAKTTAYTYDEEGNVKTVTDPTSRVVTYGYDLGGTLTSVGTSTLGVIVTVTPDGYGQRGGVAYGNGTSGAVAFDKNGRPTNINWSAPIAQFGYTRDNAGNPTTVTESLGGAAENLTITYDTLNRPTVSTAGVNPATRSETFAYDLNGNVTNPGSGGATTYNAANQPIAHAGTTYTYDQRGNRATAVPGSGDSTITTHDPENRIVTIVKGPSRVDLTYDGLERPVQIVQDGVTSRIVYAAQNRLVTYDAAGAVTGKYTTSPRMDDVFAVEAGGNVYYAHVDTIGSVRAVTNAAGAVVGTRKLGLYGRLIATTGTPDLIPLGFGARPFYLGGALIDQRARLYDPVLANFVSQDPLGVLTKFPNPYAYASNRPFMFVDPLGLSPEGPSLWNRIFGGLKAIGGLAEGALGVLGLLAPEPTMLTKVGGVLLIGHGADQLQAGLRQLWTGENVRTLTSQGLGAGAELLGFDANTAYYIGEFGDAGIGIVLSLGTTAGLQAATATAPRIGATGQVGEQALQALGGESQVFFQTSQGARYVDQLVNGIANESKVGYTSLTQSVTTQIAKDAELLNSGQVNGVVWHFFTSPVTGQVGPSGPLLQALQNAGITVVIH